MSIFSGLGQVIGAGMGMAMAKKADKRQLAQQEKLQKLQVAGAKEMGKFNQELAMKTWKDTNYEAQRRELQKAGLNVGLMYEGGGQGGTTSGGSAAMPTGATAQGANRQEWATGMGMGLANTMQGAQIELTKALTKKAEAEADKTAGIDTEVGAATLDKLKADTSNAEMQGRIMVYDKAIKEVEANIAYKSQDEILRGIKAANDKLEEEVKSAGAAAKVDQATVDAKIQQIRTATAEQQLRIAAQKAGLIKTNADTKAVEQGIAKVVQDMELDRQMNKRDWQRMSNEQIEMWIRQELMENEKHKTNFNTSTPAQIRQWTEIIGGIISAAKVVH